MTPAAKPAAIRFYVDADVLGLAKLLVQVRNDVTYPGDPGGVLHKRARPACLITSPGVLDHIWIPEVTQQGWLILTRDSNIADNRAEITAVRESGARMVRAASKLGDHALVLAFRVSTGVPALGLVDVCGARLRGEVRPGPAYPPRGGRPVQR